MSVSSVTIQLDHVLWAAPSLDPAAEAFSRVTGVEPSVGGSHPGFGTRNKLVGLGERLFFEIIAPDPAQSEKGVRADAIAELVRPEMHAYCLQTDDLVAVAERAAESGLGVSAPVAMSRTRPDGITLEWEICYLESDRWGDVLPFLIDWKGSPHPAETSAQGCRLAEFSVLHPEAADLEALFDRLKFPVSVVAAPRAGMVVRLSTPKGEVVFT